MYLLEIQQGNRRHIVGLFTEKQDAIEWIESIPYVHKNEDTFETETFITYTMNYEDLPLYEEINWQTSLYPITKYMFTPDDGPIEFFLWDELQIMNHIVGQVEGTTQVDAYLIPNPEVNQYIHAREEIRKDITNYYEQLGKKVQSGGIGSEDGEYLWIEDGPFIHLDAPTIQQWQARESVKQFIRQLEN